MGSRSWQAAAEGFIYLQPKDNPSGKALLEGGIETAQAAAALDGSDPAEDSLGGDAAIRAEHGIALGDEAGGWVKTGWGGNPDDAMDEEGVLGVAEEKDIANPDRPVEEGVDFE